MHVGFSLTKLNLSFAERHVIEILYLDDGNSENEPLFIPPAYPVTLHSIINAAF